MLAVQDGEELKFDASLLIPDWASYLIPEVMGWTEVKASVPGLPIVYSRTAFGHGWPMLAMWNGNARGQSLAGQTVNMVVSGIELPAVTSGSVLSGSSNIERALPLGIIWLGFVVDSVIYATAWIILICGASWLLWTRRSQRRIRRGLCPACAYPAGTSPVCTECGRALPDELLKRRGVGRPV